MKTNAIQTPDEGRPNVAALFDEINAIVRKPYVELARLARTTDRAVARLDA